MFSNLGQNSIFYILDKNNKPVLKIGKVTKATITPQSYGLTNQSMDITVDVNGNTYEFQKIPANLSIVSPSTGIVISDNPEDMTKEYEMMVKTSQQIIDSIEYHQSIIDSKDEIMSALNPRFAKEKEQENKIIALENKVTNIEQGIFDMKSMMSQLLNKNKGD